MMMNDCSAFVCRPVSLQKVWLEEDVEQISGQTLDGVINRENMDLFPVLYIRTGIETETHTASNIIRGGCHGS